jgi:hypothetical protein
MTPAERARRFFAQQNVAPGYWRRQARKRIIEALSEVAASNSASEVLAHCDAAYPFGPREHHPYKAWLKERKLLKDALGLGKAPVRGPLVPLFERTVDE